MIEAETIALAHRLADAAGEAIRPYFRRRIDVADKGAAKGKAFDPVTEADREAERVIRAILERERPDDGILGEEFGETPGTSGRRWVLDPVDGTRAFIGGRHEWGSLIALEDKGRPVLGIIDQPVLGERFFGVNRSATLITHDETLSLKVRECAALSEAILCCTHPTAYFDAAERAALERLSAEARMTRFGGDCYIFGLLAMGFCDLIVESSLHRWDVAALIPVVEGAGGIITDWQGGDCSHGGQVVAAGDARVHQAALKLLRG
ncbi:MAG: histidinol-phosphatase [Alphaproteobacteria bacterium]|nr:histidinol-phosphatase [Alphaproteobacteria bacterium]MBV9694341.1 histidinol-phosphatase [Alphaproteobacteria bacterium]